MFSVSVGIEINHFSSIKSQKSCKKIMVSCDAMLRLLEVAHLWEKFFQPRDKEVQQECQQLCSLQDVDGTSSCGMKARLEILPLILCMDFFPEMAWIQSTGIFPTKHLNAPRREFAETSREQLLNYPSVRYFMAKVTDVRQKYGTGYMNLKLPVRMAKWQLQSIICNLQQGTDSVNFIFIEFFCLPLEWVMNFH